MGNTTKQIIAWFGVAIFALLAVKVVGWDKPTPKPTQPFTAGQTVLVQDCYSWNKVKVVSTTDSSVFVEGKITSGTCASLPMQRQQIIEVPTDRVKSLPPNQRKVQ